MTDLDLSVLGALALMVWVALSAARLKVMGSSVLIHHLGSHGMGLANRELARRVADVIGVLTLNLSANDYQEEHKRHHGLVSFARHDADPDAALMRRLGFLPGMSEAALWRRLAWVLVSPVVQLQLSVARLRAVFARPPAWRLALAWTFWPGVLALAAAGGHLAAVLLGFVAPLLVAGNIAALLELASEHAWDGGDEAGMARQAALSHGRYPGVMPPPAGLRGGRAALAWAAWGLRMLGAIAVRYAVLPGDLPHHDSHHLGRRPARMIGRWGWVNAARSYSPWLWADVAQQQHATSSLRQAIGRWFKRLAARK